MCVHFATLGSRSVFVSPHDCPRVRMGGPEKQRIILLGSGEGGGGAHSRGGRGGLWTPADR